MMSIHTKKFVLHSSSQLREVHTPKHAQLDTTTRHDQTSEENADAQLYAPTSSNLRSRTPMCSMSNSTLSRDLPPLPYSGRQSQARQRTALRIDQQQPRPRGPTRRASRRTLSRDLPPLPDCGCKPRSTNRTRAGAQPYAAKNENHYGREPSPSTSSGTLSDAHRNMGPKSEGSGQPLIPRHHSMEDTSTRRLQHSSIEAQWCSTPINSSDGEQPQANKKKTRRDHN